MTSSRHIIRIEQRANAVLFFFGYVYNLEKDRILHVYGSVKNI